MKAWDRLTKEEQERRRNLQLVAEEQMLLDSEARYWEAYDRAPDEAVPEQDLLRYCVQSMTPMYRKWINKLSRMKRTPTWVHPLFAVGPERMADITMRCLMQQWFSSAKMRSVDALQSPSAVMVAEAITELTVQVVAYRTARRSNPEEWRKQSHYIKKWNRRRCIAFSRRLNAITKQQFLRKYRQDFGHNMLRIAEQSGIIKLTIVRRNKRRHTLVRFSDEVMRHLSESHSDMLAKMAVVHKPMIAPPIPHTEVSSGGNYMQFLRKPVVQRFKDLTWEGVIRRQRSSVPSKMVVDGLNTLMGTELKVNSRVRVVMETLFRNNTQDANLPAYNFEEFVHTTEYPKNGTKEEKAKWCSIKHEAYSTWFKSFYDRMRMTIRLRMAKDLEALGLFYHVYTCDFRGRAYCACDLLSPQGSDLDRSLIEMANPVKQTKAGLFWLKVHVANLFDRDKGRFEQRVAWVDRNMPMFKRINEDPYGTRKAWVSDKKRKNPSFSRLAAVFDLCRTDGLTSLPVQMDGTCNGVQHWAAITGDPILAAQTNLEPVDDPNDLYGTVASVVTERMRRVAGRQGSGYLKRALDTVADCDKEIKVLCKQLRKSPDSDKERELHNHRRRRVDAKQIIASDWAARFLDHWPEGIPRDVCKRPVMTDPYGITFYGIRKYVKSEGHVDWVGKENVAAAVMEMASFIHDAMQNTMVEPNKCKAWLKQVGKIASDKGKHLVWTTPCGFKVVHEYYLVKSRISIATLFNRRELWFGEIDDESIDEDSVDLAIAPNLIHSFDASHMWSTIDRLRNAGVEDLSFIHDSYGCLSPFIPMLRTFTLEEFHKLHSLRLLWELRASLQEELGVDIPPPPDRGTYDINKVLEAEYAFQ